MARRLLNDKRAIVTGASSGIGRELVLQLARLGTHCVATARREAELTSLADEVRQQSDSGGTEIEVVVGDITEPALREQLCQRAESSLGGLDILINNAGVGSFGRFDGSDEARLRKIMEVNFFAAAELMRQALPLLRKGRDPIVVNVGSILGHRAIPRMNEYCASKFALRALSETVRVELKSAGIDLLLVSPGTTETEFYDQVIHGRGKVPWRKGKGLTSAAVARATIRAMEKRKREIIPNWPGGLLVWANKWCPALIDWWLIRYA